MHYRLNSLAVLNLGERAIILTRGSSRDSVRKLYSANRAS